MLMYLGFVLMYLGYLFIHVLHLDALPYMLNVDILAGFVIFGVLPLLGAGMIKDFGNAFRMVFTKTKEMNVTKMKRATDAIELEIRAQIIGMAAMAAGVVFKVFNSLEFTQNLQPTAQSVGSSVGAYLNYVLLPLFCSLLTASLLLPLKYRIKGMMADFIGSKEE